MHRFILGTLEVIVASLIVNWILNSSFFTTSYTQSTIPNLAYPTITSTSTPTPTKTSLEQISKGSYIVWRTLEEAMTYHNDDYSYTFRDKFLKEHKFFLVSSGDKYIVLEVSLPYQKIKVTELRNSAPAWDRAHSIVNNEGWIK